MTKIKEPYRCDECGKLREKDANRWWVLSAYRQRGEFSMIWLTPWNEEAAKRPVSKHICGREHVLTLVDRWMATGSFVPPSARPVSSVEPKSSSTRKEGPDGKDDAPS